MAFEFSERLSFILRLHLTPGIGPQTIKKLVQKIPNLADIFTSSSLDALRINPKLKQAILNPKYQQLAEQEMETAAHQKVRLLDFLSADYPKLLKEIYDPPPILYVKGELPEEHFPIAVVGTRRPSHYGKQLVQDTLLQIKQRMPAVQIISGLAYGIDTLAHRHSLHLGLPTVAVLGSGLGVIYPSQNRGLAREIIEHGGAVITEYTWNTTPAPQNFPNRNRIISGLAKAIWIPEAGAKSGALITARAALEQNRDVFASPGQVDSAYSAGSHWLIQQNRAKLLLHGVELLENADIPLLVEKPKIKPKSKTDTTPPADILASKILSLLEGRTLNPNELAEKSQIPVSQLLAKLTEMEIHGLIQTTANGDLAKARTPYI